MAKLGAEPSAVQQLVKISAKPWIGGAAGSETVQYSLLKRFDTLVGRASSVTELSSAQELVECIVTMFASSSELHTSERDASLTETMGRPKPSFMVVEDLKSHRCPSGSVFKRIACEDRVGNVPNDQLATLCDVAVVRLLCRCSNAAMDGSAYGALTWALDYVKRMLGSLIEGPLQRTRTGWYGVRMRRRLTSQSSFFGPAPFTRSSTSPAIVEGVPTESESTARYTIDVQGEISTCITSEGRISLLAILSALSALPEKVLDMALLNRIRPIIQFCLDVGSGLPGEQSSAGGEHKRQQHLRPMTLKEAGRIHSQEVVHGVLEVLARCFSQSDCLFAESHDQPGIQGRPMTYGSDEGRKEKMRQLILSLKDKLLFHVFTNHGSNYRKWLSEYVSTQPIAHVLSFLHCVLSYCRTYREVEEGASPSKITFCATTAALSFRPLVDRLIPFDLSETAIQQSSTAKNILLESCQFVHYCQHLLQCKEAHVVDAVKQLHMHVQRVALSVVFISNITSANPSRSASPEPESPFKESAPSAQSSCAEPGLDLSGTHTASHFVEMVKKATIASNSASNHPAPRRAPTPTNIWQVLPLGEVHSRLQRLALLMDLSKPGTVPEPNLLASLLDFTKKAPVVLRAAVFMECAYFVRRLRSGARTPWVLANIDKTHDVLPNLKRWGEAVGFKLQEILQKENQPSFTNAERTLDPPIEGTTLFKTAGQRRTVEEPLMDVLDEEEPVYPDRKTKGSSIAVCYALKAAACQLLQEITGILLDPPRVYHAHLAQKAHLDASENVASFGQSSAECMESSQGFHRGGRAYRKGRRQSVAHSRAFDDVTRRNTLRNPKVNVVYTKDVLGSTESLRSSDNPNPALPTVQDTSPGPAVRQRKNTLSALLAPTSAGQRISQNISKLISSIGLSGGSFRHSTRRRSMVASTTSPSLTFTSSVRRKSVVGESASSEYEAVHIPWLETVAQLLQPSTLRVPEHERDHAMCLKMRKKQCAKLTASLLKIYSYQPEPRRRALTPDFLSHKKSKWDTASFSSKRSTLSQSPATNSRQRTHCLSPEMALSAFQGKGSPLEELLEGTRTMQYSPCAGCSTLPVLLERDALLFSLEYEATFSTKMKVEEFGRSRQAYMKDHVANLLASMFVTVMACVTDLSKLSVCHVQDTAWQLLLDPDKELASLASAFFLLFCDKASHKEMSKFFSSKMEGTSDAEKRETIARFTMLWSVRYQVLPKIPRDTQKKIRANELNLGYALPTPRLGSESAEIPLPPWQPVSICTGECKTDPKKCNHPTHLSPTLIHTVDILRRSKEIFLSGVSVAQKASSDSSKLVMVVDEHQSSIDSTDRAWQFAVFPDSLLPLVLQVLSLASGVEEDETTSSHKPDKRGESASRPTKLDDMADVALAVLQQRRKNLLDAQFDSSTCKLSTSLAAKDTIFDCLVEDHILFFQPFLRLLNLAYLEFGKRATKGKTSRRAPPPIRQMSVDEELDEALHGLRVVLLTYPTLPPDASRYLFNHLIGIVMQHSHHSYKESPKLITGVLDLLQMLPASIQGLNSKQIKNSLKKESCYPTIMTTARIQGLSKVDVCFKMSEQNHTPRIMMTLSEDTTVQDIVETTLRQMNKSLEKMDRFVLHVVPKEYQQKKFIPDESTKLMKSLVLQDHFSARTETLLLDIEQEDLWTQNNFEREQLLMHKLAEASRVLLAKKLLLSADNCLEEFYFMKSELTALASFPRKALDNVYSRDGHSHPSLADLKHLHCVDTMLKGNWLEFILALFRAMPKACPWSSEILLFLSVVSGSLLLHVEDVTILRLSLAIIIAVIHKFPSGPRDEAAHLIVSTVIHVYAVHGENELVCQGLQHLWSHLHAIETEEYQFLLEAVTASLTMLSMDSEVPNQQSTFVSALLEHSMTVAHASQPQIAKAVLELNKTVTASSPPVDHLGVEDIAGVPPVKQWNPIPLSKVFNLYVTVVTAGPEKQRGLQMLVFLDHIAPLMVQSLRQDKAYLQLGPLVGGLRNLARACEARGNIYLRAGTTAASTTRESGKFMSRLTSLVARHNVGYDLSSASLHYHSANKGGVEMLERHGSVPVDKKQQKQESSLNTLSTTIRALDSLLSLATVISEALRATTPTAKQTQRHSRRESHMDINQRIDSKSASNLCTTAIHLVKQSLFRKEDETDVPILKGCDRFTSTCIPNFEWSDPSFTPVMTLYVNKVTRLFRKLALEPQFHQSMWQRLCSVFKGINLTLERNPALAASSKDLLATLLDSVFNVNRIIQASSVEDSETSTRRVENAITFLKLMPKEFSVAYTTLAKTLLVVTAKASSAERYTLCDLFQGKVTAPNELVKALIVRKVVNPLLIVLGALPDFTLDRKDVDFLIVMFLSMAKDISRVMPRQGYPLKSAFKSLFLGVKVVAISCQRSLTAVHWLSLAHGITAMGTKDAALSRKRSRTEMNKDLARFYKEFLVFVEEFVLVHPTPLRLYLWPALAVVESGLYDEKAILDEKLSRKQPAGLDELSSRLHHVPQDRWDEEDQICNLDNCIEALQRIKDTYFEDRDHLGHQEMLEGFETELFGGLFDMREASEYACPSNRKQSRSASISEFFTRKKREIFATLGSSLSKAEGDLSKITEEEEEEDLDVTPSHSTAAMGSRGRALVGRRSPRLHLRGTENLSSDEEEESSRNQPVRRSGPRARKLGIWVPRDMSYEADTETTSPVQHLPAHSGVVTVCAELHKSKASVSSETSSLIEGSRRSSAATVDAPTPARRPTSSTDMPMLTTGPPHKLGPRKMSDTLLLPSGPIPAPAVRWPSDSHLSPEKPRGLSPMLISQRANNNAVSPDEAGSRRPFALVRSHAVVEESPTPSPDTHSRNLAAEIAMIESPTSGQRRPLLPGDSEREPRRSASSLSQQQQQEGEQWQQRGEEQFSHALGLALQDLNKEMHV